jgi:hypothetical protein
LALSGKSYSALSTFVDSRVDGPSGFEKMHKGILAVPQSVERFKTTPNHNL